MAAKAILEQTSTGYGYNPGIYAPRIRPYILVNSGHMDTNSLFQ